MNSPGVSKSLLNALSPSLSYGSPRLMKEGRKEVLGVPVFALILVELGWEKLILDNRSVLILNRQILFKS